MSSVSLDVCAVVAHKPFVGVGALLLRGVVGLGYLMDVFYIMVAQIGRAHV